MFTRNEGALDRGLRVAAGVALLGLTLTGTIGAWGWLGAIPLVTGALGSCPIYTLFGVSTCGTRS